MSFLVKSLRKQADSDAPDRGALYELAGEIETEIDHLRDRAERNEDRAVEAEKMALDLANALDLAHAATHPLHIAEPVESCGVCALLVRARRWAR